MLAIQMVCEVEKVTHQQIPLSSEDRVHDP
jgi:hypothetical protein